MTPQEEVFYFHSYNGAKQLEAQSRWREAGRSWRNQGFNSEAQACDMIAAAGETGDEFRATVKRIMADHPTWAHTCTECGHVDIPYQVLQDAHERVYGK